VRTWLARGSGPRELARRWHQGTTVAVIGLCVGVIITATVSPLTRVIPASVGHQLVAPTWEATKAPLPAKPGGLASEFSASCAGAGSCLVSDGASGLETLSGGTWTSTEAAPLPADAYSPPDAGLESVSCAGAGSCVVAGSYFDTTRVDQGLLETLSDGKWTATKAPLPAAARSYGKPGVALSSVSCVSVGRCFVVGSYGDPLGPSEQGLLETLSDGKWTATEAPLPADANRSLTAALGTVSCASAGSCVAAGFYNATSVIGQGLLETLSDGKWTATKAPLPADANREFVASLGQVSCAVAGSCVAVGLYNYNPGPKTGNWLGQGLLETLSDGTWTATKAPLPADASSYSYPNTDLYSVSCAGAGSCVAVGSYDHIGSLNGSGQGLLETLSDGKWTATKAPLPADASSYSSTTPPGANLYSVSCAGAGSCVAVGAYDLFGSDLGQGLLETLSDGKWTAIKAPVPAGGNVAALFSVSCSENGSCAAAGSYAGEGNSQDFLEALSGGTSPTGPPPGGTPPGEPSLISWLAAGDSYASGAGLTNTTKLCARAPGTEADPSMAWAVVASRSKVLEKDHFGAPDLVACIGAKTGEFFKQQGKNPAEWTPSMGQYDLVTFSFGGNDIGFDSIIESCYLHGSVCSNQTVRSRISALAQVFPGFLTHVATSAVITGGNVVVMGYPELIEDPSLWPQINRDTHQCQGIDTNTSKSIRGWAGALNAAIGNAVNQVNALPVAKRNGVHFTFIDVVTGQLSDGIDASNPDLFEPATGVRHELCSQGDDAWLNGLTIHLSTRSMHPNQAGEDAMGNLATEVISGLSWPWSPPS
jgi:hypothetical protein